MARTVIDIGSSPGDGTGDTLHAAGQKINDMTQELYDGLSGGTLTMENITTGSSPMGGSTGFRDAYYANTKGILASGMLASGMLYLQ